MTNFKVGQKVVCKDDSNQFNGILLGYTPVRKHDIYTVRGFDKFDALLLEEIINPICILKDDSMGESGYFQSRFRPIHYADATQEILSKFKPTEDTPDREVVIPEIVENH
jgi:hypothetical protein